MAIDIGPGSGSLGDSFGGETWVSENNPANAAGTIDHLECYLDSSGNIQFGTWYGSPYTFDVRDYTSTLNGASGLNEFDAPADFTALSVETGDYLAIYSAADLNYEYDTGYYLYYVGDNTIDTGETDSDGNYNVSIYGTGTESGGTTATASPSVATWIYKGNVPTASRVIAKTVSAGKYIFKGYIPTAQSPAIEANPVKGIISFKGQVPTTRGISFAVPTAGKWLLKGSVSQVEHVSTKTPTVGKLIFKSYTPTTEDITFVVPASGKLIFKGQVPTYTLFPIKTVSPAAGKYFFVSYNPRIVPPGSHTPTAYLFRFIGKVPDAVGYKWSAVAASVESWSAIAASTETWSAVAASTETWSAVSASSESWSIVPSSSDTWSAK